MIWVARRWYLGFLANDSSSGKFQELKVGLFEEKFGNGVVVVLEVAPRR